MSAYNPERTTHSPAPDTQTIIGLLGGLMPLLQQLQSQFPGGPPQTGAWDPGFGFSPLASAPQSPLLDHQAATEMVEDINACALRNLSTYLETYASQHASLGNAVSLVTQAARCFAARDGAQTFALIWQTYRAITMARAVDRELPSPRVVASGAASSASILH